MIKSIKRLVKPETTAGNFRRKIQFHMPSRGVGYNICIVKSDESAILMEGVLHEGREDNAYYIHDDKDTDVLGIIVSPSIIGLRSGVYESNPFVTIDDDAQFHVHADNECDPETTTLFIPQRKVNWLAVLADKRAYEIFKRRACLETICVVGVADATMVAMGHTPEAVAFAIGGSLGLSYLLQLMLQVDNIDKNGLSKALGAMRFFATACAIGYLDHTFAKDLRDQPSLMLWALLGFMSFRVALLSNTIGNDVRRGPIDK